MHFTYPNFRLKDATMKHYHHLTQEQRYTISAEMRTTKSHSQIAPEIGCTRQTVWREITRNAGLRGYRPKQAHDKAMQRSQTAAQQRQSYCLTAFGLAYIEHLIRRHWSPEQIHGGLTAMGWLNVPSHEWIYQHIDRDKQAGGVLHTHLRCQKTYRKRGLSGNERRGQIPNKSSIHLRPFEIEQRQRLGDIEGDTIIGRHHKGAVLTLLERKSLYLWLKPLARRTALATAQACTQALAGVRACSITFDNGKEFTMHQAMKVGTGADIYFAHAYQSNQRARNENSNGLIRQFLPKSMRLDNLDHAHVAQIARALNTRPRKTLGWKTPEQVLSSFTLVALQG